VSPGALAGLAFGALRAHRVRTRLTVAAVAIGVAAVLLLTTLGQSARAYVVDQFAGIGANLVVVLPGRVETGGAGAAIAGGSMRALTLADAEAVAREVSGVAAWAPIAAGVALVSAGARERSVMVMGSTPAFVAVRGIAVRLGRNLPPIDPRTPAQACLLGHKAAAELFPGENPLGAPLRVGDQRFRVTGVLAPVGQQLGADFDDLVVIPVANAQRLVNREGLFRVIVKLTSADRVPEAERTIRRVLTERHRGEDFTIVTPRAMLGALDDILAALTMALAAIAAISLGVAGVGVMNVMLISVAERVPEVGLMKALGASRGQVLGLFLAEAALLALSGGLAGVAAGWTAARAIALAAPAFPLVTPVWAVEAALAVSAGVGLVFGAVPAARAARLPPVEALAGRA
jgi:putative ABC transport system permease protein